MNEVTEKGDLKPLAACLAYLNGLRVVVGVRGQAGSEVYPGEGQPLTLVDVATVHEFGSANGVIPERSFLRSTLDRNGKKYAKRLREAIARAIEAAAKGGDWREAVDRDLSRLGVLAVGDVQQTIRDSGPGWPALSPVTIARKGSSKPLIDTGRLRQSIDHELRRL